MIKPRQESIWVCEPSCHQALGRTSGNCPTRQGETKHHRHSPRPRPKWSEVLFPLLSIPSPIPLPPPAPPAKSQIFNCGFLSPHNFPAGPPGRPAAHDRYDVKHYLSYLPALPASLATPAWWFAGFVCRPHSRTGCARRLITHFRQTRFTREGR